MHSELRAAIQGHQSGQLGTAAQLYQAVLAREPTNAEALHLLGVLCTTSKGTIPAPSS